MHKTSIILSFLVLLHIIFTNPTWCISPPITMFNAPNITKPGCPRKCGNLIVPYPFGVGLGAGCSKSVLFDVFCMTSYDPPKAFLVAAMDDQKNAMEILDISETQLRLRNQISYSCFNSTDVISPRMSDFITFNLITPRPPYSVSGN